MAKSKANKQEPGTLDNEPMEIDLKAMYAFDPADMVPDVTITRYSNTAYITCSTRDVFIDFLEMPGVKRDGKVLVNATRIFMSHAAAKKLAEVTLRTLEAVHRGGQIETYAPHEGEEKALSTKVKRTSMEESSQG
ncbi:MAG: DUF3467 domain-containing protein [Methanomicrobiales archaeon]|nr:DUF3467 domain-containing protein [Methanomicrobiales archaeon]MDI6877028.1 DUF3467 domain-containing protein [Methanomicrobiales archaeon]